MKFGSSWTYDRNCIKSLQTSIPCRQETCKQKICEVFKEVRSNLEAYISCSGICNKIISFCILSDKILTLLVAPHSLEVKCEQKIPFLNGQT